MIKFIEHLHTGYPLRTRNNAMTTDGTLAIAVNFKSSGMMLTYKCCVGAGKPFIKVDISEYKEFTEALDIATQLMEANIKHLNIAGNSPSNLGSKYTQQALNVKVAHIMNRIHEIWPLEAVTTGGQNGVDLAGALWADSVGIPCTVRAPRGWTFRLDNGRDVSNEYLFVKRFGDQYDMSDII